MKRQWNLILAFIFALIVAVFAVTNVDPVEVDYLFGTANWPLILVILGSVVMGAIIIGTTGMFKYFSLKREIHLLKKENQRLKDELQKQDHIADQDIDTEQETLEEETEASEIQEK
jgi:lipopolysaccharide assembly protein A